MDRRQTPRCPIDLAARLSAGGTEYVGRGANLSAGGALLRGIAAVPVGMPGRLHLDGVAAALGCDVRGADKDGTRIACALDAAGRAVLQPLLRSAASAASS
ncbi:MAG TPA: PilZ domain-containing protein [Acetobacteraceae bacterium]|nr:PilZ domain-containing protein [Acetobacteraceae bacterium]